MIAGKLGALEKYTEPEPVMRIIDSAIRDLIDERIGGEHQKYWKVMEGCDQGRSFTGTQLPCKWKHAILNMNRNLTGGSTTAPS